MWRNLSTQFWAVALAFCLFFFIGLCSVSPEATFILTETQRNELIQAFQTLEADNEMLRQQSMALQQEIEVSKKILETQESLLRTSSQHLNGIATSLNGVEKSLMDYRKSMENRLTEKKIEIWIMRAIAAGLAGWLIIH